MHRISQKLDKRVLIATDILDEYKKYYKTLDYSQQRELATKELKKRGNPPYNPSEYLVKDNWKL